MAAGRRDRVAGWPHLRPLGSSTSGAGKSPSLQAQRTGLFMGMILLFRDDKHRWEFPNFRVWEEIPDFLLKAEKTEGLWPFGSGDIRRSEGQRGKGHAQRNWGLAWMPGPGFFGNQREERAAGQEMSGSSLLWLSFRPWLCRATSVWLHLGPGVALLSFCPPAENRAKDVCGK